MLKNLKISMKLVLGFGLVLVMLLISAGVAIFNMSAMGEQIDHYANITVPNVNSVWQIRRDMVSAERNMLAAIVETDQNEMNKYIDMAGENAQNVTLTLEAFSQNTALDKEKLKSFTDSLGNAGTIQENISNFLIKGEKEKAYNLFDTQYLSMFEKSAEIALSIYEFEEQSADEQNNMAHRALNGGRIILIVVVILALLITIIATAILRKAILTPVKEIDLAAQLISNGDLSATITYDGKDELGELSNAMKKLVGIVVGIIKDLDYSLSEMGKGNFTVESPAKELYIGDFDNLHTSMEQIMVQLSSTLSQINQASVQIAIGSDQVSSGAQALSQGASEQASSVEEVAATINDISVQIKKNAESAKNGKISTDETGALVI